MEETFDGTLKAKEEPPDYEDNFLPELKPEVLDLDYTQETKVSSDLFPAAEEIGVPVLHIVYKKEPDDEEKEELKHSILLGSLPSRVSNTTPEEMLFVNPDDVLHTFSSSPKVENIDPLSDVKHDSHSGFVGAEQSSMDDVMDKGSCVRELSTSPVTHTCFGVPERLEIPVNISMEHHEILVPGPLQSRSSNPVLSQPQVPYFGTLQLTSSVEMSSEENVSTLQHHTSTNLQEDPTGPVPKHQANNSTFNFEYSSQCSKKNGHGPHVFVGTGEYQKQNHAHQESGQSHLTPPMTSPTGNRPYQCSECNKSFTQKRNLISHLSIHTGERPYQCSQCDKRFRVKSILNTHIRLHTGERPYHCSLCEKRFTVKSLLNTHLKIHTGERRYHCSQCELSFTGKRGLNTHVKTHSEERLNQCSQCNRCFSTQISLNSHVRLHTGERPYRCYQCDKGYTSKSSLTTHVKYHTHDHPYQCSQCDKGFNLEKKLTDHLSFHTRGRRYQCSRCIKTFRTESILNSHLRLHALKPRHQCSECNKSFTAKRNLDKHVCVHTKEDRNQSSQCDFSPQTKGASTDN